MVSWHQFNRIFVIYLSMQFSARGFFVMPAPLFEKESHIIAATYLIKFVNPTCFDFSRVGAGFSTNYCPMNFG